MLPPSAVIHSIVTVFLLEDFIGLLKCLEKVYTERNGIQKAKYKGCSTKLPVGNCFFFPASILFFNLLNASQGSEEKNKLNPPVKLICNGEIFK